MQFEWNIDPEMIRLFNILPIRYYSILFALGLILGYLVVKQIWIKEKLSVEKLDKLALFIFVGTIVGARLGHCLFYEPDYYLKYPLEIILPFSLVNGNFEYVGFQGLASHGGIAAVFIAIWYYCKKSNSNIFSVLDKIAIGGALTAVFIRLGNFMNSEIIGKATRSNYGIVFTKVDNVLRHPAQLYESFAYLLIFIILFFLYRNKSFGKDGFIFGLFFILLFIARFLIEFFKINQVDFENNMIINMGQVLSIPFIVAGIIIMFLKRKPIQIARSSQD